MSKKKSTVLASKVPVEVAEKARLAAAYSGETVSSLIRKLLVSYVSMFPGRVNEPQDEACIKVQPEETERGKP